MHDALIVLTNHKTGEVRKIWARNIVTNEGDKYYAQKACGETPTNAFAQIYLCTAGPATPAKDDNYGDFTVSGGTGNPSAAESGYPKTNDDDADNTGSGVDIVSWEFDFATTDGPFTTITHCFISIAAASGTDPILNSYKWASSWSKDADTSAKIFTNHTVNGT